MRTRRAAAVDASRDVENASVTEAANDGVPLQECSTCNDPALGRRYGRSALNLGAEADMAEEIELLAEAELHAKDASLCDGELISEDKVISNDGRGERDGEQDMERNVVA